MRDETSWLAARGPWLLWALDFNLSIAAAVGFIALAGVAAETGGELRAKCSAAYRPFTRADLNVAIVRGAWIACARRATELNSASQWSGR